MAKLKYYVLCCRNMHGTKRHLDYIPKEDLVIVLNSWVDAEGNDGDKNAQYLMDAEAWCISKGVEYYVTESDGTPSTGKNSVMKLFRESDNDYMVLVDGDDFITPHGIWLYDKIAQSNSPPDAIALEYQMGINADTFYQNAPNETNPKYIPGYAYRSFMHSYEWWQATLAGEYIPVFDEYSKRLNEAHTKVYSFAYEYIDNWEHHLRLTFYSKKAAAIEFTFDPNLIVGEDTMQYNNLKYAWSQGNIDLRHLHEIYPTYVYDQRLDGIVCYANKRDQDWGAIDWMDKLAAEYDRVVSEGKAVKAKPPYVNLPEFPVDYEPNTDGLVNYPHKAVKY